MNLLLFSIIVSVISWLPYIPVAVAGVKSGIFRDNADEHCEIKPVNRFVLILCMSVFLVMCSAFYLIEIAPFNGQIDTSKLFGAQAKDYATLWEMARYLSGALGLLLGGLLINSVTQIRASHPGFGKLFLATAVFCILYGAAIPFLMSSLVDAIRDSHLMH